MEKQQPNQIYPLYVKNPLTERYKDLYNLEVLERKNDSLTWERGEKNMKAEKMNETEIEMVKAINGEILKRTEYGMRVEKIVKGWTKLSWSNGSEEWGCDNIRSYGTMKIDANEIIVPYAAKDVIPVVEFLAELPLFRHSTEAVERGYVSREEAIMELEMEKNE